MTPPLVATNHVLDHAAETDGVETPALAHFVWLGPRLPWVYAMAIRSAVLRGGFARVVVHHEPGLAASDLAAIGVSGSQLEARVLDVAALGRAAGVRPDRMAALLDGLGAPAARANVLRVLVLAAHGGVYLDTDTVTLRPLDEQRAAGRVFFGLEHVAYPWRAWNGEPRPHPMRSLALSALRSILATWNGGHRAFTRIDRLYPLAANNAVLGGPAGHPFWRHLLERMLALPPERQTRRYALGTHLLQQASAEWTCDSLLVLGPRCFYPIGPGLADHWFRRRRDAGLDDLLTSECAIVHWYASGARRAQIARMDADYVRAHADQQWLSRLLLPIVPA